MTALSAKQKIVVIGSGAYVKNLMLHKYAQSERCEIDCIVSPNALSKSWIKSEKFDNIKILTKKYKNHVFDFSVFPSEIIFTLEHLISIGATKFIFPKPTADTKLDYFNLEKIIEKNKIAPLVSSQWYYSTMFDNFKNPSNLEFNFSKQLNSGFDYYNSFLPHILQIIQKMNLNLKYFLATELANELKIQAQHENIFVSIKNQEKDSRVIKAVSHNKEVKFVLNTIHCNGKVVTYPKIITKGQKQHKEDIISKMIEAQFSHFDGKNVDVLDFNGYKEIQDNILEIKQRAER